MAAAGHEGALWQGDNGGGQDHARCTTSFRGLSSRRRMRGTAAGVAHALRGAGNDRFGHAVTGSDHHLISEPFALTERVSFT